MAARNSDNFHSSTELDIRNEAIFFNVFLLDNFHSSTELDKLWTKSLNARATPNHLLLCKLTNNESGFTQTLESGSTQPSSLVHTSQDPQRKTSGRDGTSM